jgi:hypothetical protein
MRSSKVERMIPNRSVRTGGARPCGGIELSGPACDRGTFIPDLTLPFVPHRMLLVRSRLWVRTPLAFEWANREYDALNAKDLGEKVKAVSGEVT